MEKIVINEKMVSVNNNQSFCLEVKKSALLSLQTSGSNQEAILEAFSANRNIQIADFEDGFYDRLTIKENVHFYKKWFQSVKTTRELLDSFQLEACKDKKVGQCSKHEQRRLHYLKYGVMNKNAYIFKEPIHDMDRITIDVFMKMAEKLKSEGKALLILVSNMEDAILISDNSMKLTKNGISRIETENNAIEATEPVEPNVKKIFKLSAKVEDKVVLIDPLEINYLESHEGKVYATLNSETLALDLSLGELEKKLVPYGFYRCHRSYIVNLQKVKEIITWSKNTYSLKIDNQKESTIPLSRNKISEIQRIFDF
ncbi:LytTR family transcriptional regulator DNA-binding domain-containing protein [Salipaludibacillus sp. HK11]|uniref:LytTR family transcriptional regulator DNA-binding domain-containing protein n=1 Tax=Salipaludibacillus sp. HK11 TaxID=3394320 RepID=UPI0039FC2BBA